MGWIAAAGILAVAAGAGWWAAPWRKTPEREVVRFQVQPPEKMGFAFTTPPVVSPDGRKIAFIANTDGGAFGQV